MASFYLESIGGSRGRDSQHDEASTRNYLGVAVEESKAIVFDRLVHAGPPEEAPDLFETACVLGGSIAGMAAARVLADYARQVVIIERDTINEEGMPRVGTPQD